MSDTNDITLIWSDPNMIEKGHRIYRSEAPMDVESLPTPIASIMKDQTMYIDRGQPVGFTRFYRVSAWIDGYEAVSQEVAIEVPPLLYLYGTSVDGSIYRYTDQGDQLWTNVNLTETYDDVTVDSSGDLLVVYGSTISKIDKNGDKVWDYTATATITGVTADVDRNIYIAHGSTVRQLDIDGQEGWMFNNSVVVNDLSFDLSTGEIVIADGNGIHTTDGTQRIRTFTIGNINEVKMDRAGMAYYRVGNRIGRYDMRDDAHVTSFDVGSAIIDWDISNDNTVFVATGNGVVVLNVETSENRFNGSYASLSSIEVNTRNDMLIANGNSIVKVGDTEQWSESRSSTPNHVALYEGNGFIEPSDIDISYRHFYEAVDLDFFSS